MPRYTDAQREEIKLTVLELYLMEVSTKDILRYLAEKKGVALKRRQIEYYLAAVKEEMRDRSGFDRKEQIGKAIASLSMIYRKAMTSDPPDLRAALAVQKEKNVLLGLITHQHEHSGKWTLESFLREQEEKIAAEGADTGDSPALPANA